MAEVELIAVKPNFPAHMLMMYALRTSVGSLFIPLNIEDRPASQTERMDRLLTLHEMLSESLAAINRQIGLLPVDETALAPPNIPSEGESLPSAKISDEERRAISERTRAFFERRGAA